VRRYENFQDGKRFSSPIQGLVHKFSPGFYTAEVLYFCYSPEKDRVIYAFGAADKSIHLESFMNVLGLDEGEKVTLRVAPGPGYVVFKVPGGRYKAVDAESFEDLSPELENLEDIPSRVNEDPSVPEIKEILRGREHVEFELYTPEKAAARAKGA
jgi:hypothetical protein